MLYFFAPTVFACTVALLLASAPLRKPTGVTQISNFEAQGWANPLTWFWTCSPTIGCWPPPRGGFSPCVRTIVWLAAPASKSITRSYVFTLNFGHGELGFTACPKAKLRPLPVYRTDPRFITPIALAAASTTVRSEE